MLLLADWAACYSPALAMPKLEKTIDVPACYISREAATRIAVRVNQTADDLADAEYAAALQRVAPALNVTPQQALQQYWNDPQVRAALRQR